MSKIQWTNETWNPIAGCSKVSAGCKNCYAIKDAHRLAANSNAKIREKYEGTVKNGNWTGRINSAADDVWTQPIRWTRPRMIFVNSMSDIFHESVPDSWIDRMFAVMALSPQHIFQVLTKRAERMRDYFKPIGGTVRSDWVFTKMARILNINSLPYVKWPLPNVWLGVSVEDQATADERIPTLLRTPAAVRWVSAEPLLGPLNLNPFWSIEFNGEFNEKGFPVGRKALDWVVAGGESGKQARPCNLAWLCSIVDQCQQVSVPCFVKQLGGNLSDFDLDWIAGATDGGSVHHPKGGDISEWPEALRVREFPRLTTD